jgi:hypothetical protein
VADAFEEVPKDGARRKKQPELVTLLLAFAVLLFTAAVVSAMIGAVMLAGRLTSSATSEPIVDGSVVLGVPAAP